MYNMQGSFRVFPLVTKIVPMLSGNVFKISKMCHLEGFHMYNTYFLTNARITNRCEALSKVFSGGQSLHMS